jgi:hypothetical protein
MTTRLPLSARNAMLDALTALSNAGAGPAVAQIRSGSQPASADNAATGTVLATFTFSDPAFGAAVAGVATVDVTPALTVAASATGTAGWYRLMDSNAATVIDGSVTATGGGGDMQINDTGLVSTVGVTITGWTISQPGS